MSSGKKTYAIIRAIYDNNYALEEFEKELDFVLSRKVGLVIIEPEQLGEVTWRWIRTGNWLHKTAVISGLLSLSTAGFSLFWKFSKYVPSVPLPPLSFSSIVVSQPFSVFGGSSRAVLLACGVLSGISAASAGVYALFWQWDPCCKYQVASSLSALPPGIAPVALGVSTGSSLCGSNHNNSPTKQSLSSNGESSNGSNGKLLHPHDYKPRSCHSLSPAAPEAPLLHPVVLVRRDDCHRKLLHNGVALLSAVVAVALVVRLSSGSEEVGPSITSFYSA